MWEYFEQSPHPNVTAGQLSRADVPDSAPSSHHVGRILTKRISSLPTAKRLTLTRQEGDEESWILVLAGGAGNAGVSFIEIINFFGYFFQSGKLGIRLLCPNVQLQRDSE
jgi:hypothetical protein